MTHTLLRGISRSTLIAALALGAAKGGILGVVEIFVLNSIADAFASAVVVTPKNSRAATGNDVNQCFSSCSLGERKLLT